MQRSHVAVSEWNAQCINSRRGPLNITGRSDHDLIFPVARKWIVRQRPAGRGCSRSHWPSSPTTLGQ
eukprot:14362897-Alexandrium_andersonii.AAC.1